jgi:hypothetical protein
VVKIKTSKSKNNMRIKQTKKDLFVCSCHNTEHQMVVLYDEDDIDGVRFPMVYVHTHLAKRPFWQRVAYGLKYIFGYQSRYGAFDEFIINPDDVQGIEKIVKHLKECEV